MAELCVLPLYPAHVAFLSRPVRTFELSRTNADINFFPQTACCTSSYLPGRDGSRFAADS